MIKIEDYIKIYPNVIKKEICDKIINQPDLIFSPARVKDGDLSPNRNCSVKTLAVEFDKEVFETVGIIIEHYAKAFEYFNTGLSTEDSGYEHLLYMGSQKGEYKTHTDHYDLHPRVLSCSLILNDNYDGGDFSFFEGEHIIKKKAGSAVVFPSNFCFPHAITPVSNGDRHAIITWIR